MPCRTNPHTDYLSTLFQHAPFGACLVEMPSLEFIWCNESYSQVFLNGVNYKEIAGKTVFEALKKPNARALEALEHVHRYNTSTNFDTIRSKIHQGQETYWSAALFPYYRESTPESQITTGVFSILIEVTDKVAAADQAKAAALKFRREKEKKEKFLELVAHEFRTPLTSILLMAQAVKKGFKLLPEPRLIELLESIESQTLRLERVICELDNPSSAFRFDCTSQTVRTRQFAQAAIKDFQLCHSSHNLTFEIETNRESLIFVDPQRLTQVLTNIFSNATRYSARGSKIHFQVSYEDNATTFIVRDEGIGLEANHLERVFHRSFRVQSDDEISGSGLGLYLAKQIVHHMDGNIWAQSDGLGKGTSFFIRFPTIEMINGQLR